MLRSGSCFLWVACLILAVAAMSEPLLAQTNTGTITGQILDPSKAVVPAARVSVTNLSTNVSKTVVSTSEGLYTAPSLEPGPYRVTVEKEGFETTLVEVVQVFTGNTTTANVTLKIGKAAQAVTVSAQATLLSPNTSTQGGTLENRLLTDLPVAERSVLGAITLLPGVQGDPSAGTSEVQSENPNPFTGPITPGDEISIGGGRPGTASILVNGSDASLPSFPRTALTFSRSEAGLVRPKLLARAGSAAGGPNSICFFFAYMLTCSPAFSTRALKAAPRSGCRGRAWLPMSGKDRAVE